jgi:hypothetical protein
MNPKGKAYEGMNEARLKMTVLWDDAPCSLVEVCRRLEGAYCLHHRPDDGGSKHL